jgi:hypothetical protein
MENAGAGLQNFFARYADTIGSDRNDNSRTDYRYPSPGRIAT